MGEPIRGDAPLETWFSDADADHSGALTVEEVQRDAARFFATLDSDRDSEIEPDEMGRYETEVAPELFRAPAGGGFGRGRFGGGERPRRGPGMGAGGPGGHGPGAGAPMRPRGGAGGAPGIGVPGLLGLRQPVAAADANLNRGVTPAEFSDAAGQRFLLLDRDRNGLLAPDELRPPPKKK